MNMIIEPTRFNRKVLAQSVSLPGLGFTHLFGRRRKVEPVITDDVFFSALKAS
ncbi:hypothetical protein [Oryzibacter oryziterrae]|uniref:hypothetical protein n=1 Tax=Oryzibacter oryziterrae TaxID=2766474 RepID=UPI001F2DB5A9|nr:hypothetical protein [Oryzibacter oryziterrae]